MAHTTIKIGSMIVAFTVVALIKSERMMLMMRKLQSTPFADLPNLITKLRARRLAKRVFTSILASTKERILSHITL